MTSYPGYLLGTIQKIELYGYLQPHLIKDFCKEMRQIPKAVFQRVLADPHLLYLSPYTVDQLYLINFIPEIISPMLTTTIFLKNLQPAIRFTY